jgi:hypothetical protein
MVFDFSNIFLSVRNLATCFALGVLDRPIFSRNAALLLAGEYRLPVSEATYLILERTRILCTRSIGDDIEQSEAVVVLSECDQIQHWMESLTKKASEHDRIEQPR